jgi:hypothetical protein
LTQSELEIAFRNACEMLADHTRWLAECRERCETAEALLDRWLHDAVYGPDTELLNDTEAVLGKRND